jgi:transketolase
VGDGDLMEGVASEAASLAGHLKLGKLIYLYDDNHISIEGSTDIAFTEDRGKRFEAYGWHVLRIKDGNNVAEIDAAIQAAKKDPRPSLIICPTIIGFACRPNRALPKRTANRRRRRIVECQEESRLPTDESFYIPADVKKLFLKSGKKGKLQKPNGSKLQAYAKKYPEQGKEFERRMAGKLPAHWDAELTHYDPDEKGLATRKQVVKSSTNWLPSCPNHGRICGSGAFQQYLAERLRSIRC